MRRRLFGFMSDRRAAAAVEFAAITPLVLLLAGGAFEVGSLVRADTVLNRLAMQYAISYANCSDTSAGACQTVLNQYVTAAALSYIAPQIPAGALTVSMAQVTMNGSTPTVEYPSGGSLSAAQTSALQAAVPSGDNGVVITITYPYKLIIFQALMTPIIGSSFTLSYTVAQLK